MTVSGSPLHASSSNPAWSFCNFQFYRHDILPPSSKMSFYKVTVHQITLFRNIYSIKPASRQTVKSLPPEQGLYMRHALEHLSAVRRILRSPCNPYHLTMPIDTVIIYSISLYNALFQDRLTTSSLSASPIYCSKLPQFIHHRRSVSKLPLPVFNDLLHCL